MGWSTVDGSPWDAQRILRRRWENGLCVCCGGWLVQPAEAIGESVMICGACSTDGHLDKRPGEREAVLRALLPGKAH